MCVCVCEHVCKFVCVCTRVWACAWAGAFVRARVGFVCAGARAHVLARARVCVCYITLGMLQLYCSSGVCMCVYCEENTAIRK